MKEEQRPKKKKDGTLEMEKKQGKNGKTWKKHRKKIQTQKTTSFFSEEGFGSSSNPSFP